MTEPRPPSFQEKERRDTDKSLVAEREKTNLELREVKTRVDAKTDRKLEEQRARTDEAVASARNSSDRDFIRDASGYDRLDEKKLSESRLRAERRRSDEAIEAERERSDIAVEAERSIKSAAEKQLLKDERDLTDKHLSVERLSTDSATDLASSRLSDEVGRHVKTKAILTTRDEFLAIVSHDLRNPIGAISSCMEILLEDTPNLDQETKSWLEFAKRNADSALRMIHDLLDVERMAQGKLEIRFQEHDLRKIVRHAMQSFVHSAAAKGVLLRASAPKEPLMICCDRDRITQVISNLVGNALKFTSEGGNISIETSSTENGVKLSVTDTGAGIPEEKLEHIFERFTQLGGHDRRGLGLGLHISKMLVEAHQGALTVKSQLGIGSTFSVFLPRHQNDETRLSSDTQ